MTTETQTGGKQYRAKGLAGCVRQTRTLKHKILVGVYRNDQADLCEDAGPWSTICEAHGEIIGHASLSVARDHASTPEDWCEQCQAAASGRA